MNITVIGDHDERTVRQLERCVVAEEGAAGVLCADGHVGYSQPVGGAVAYRRHISVSGVGYDIGCGNKAVRTGLRHDDVAADLPRVMDEIVARISFGVGRDNGEPADHAVLDAIRDADAAPQRRAATLAADQLGTVGAGNHYVDLFTDEEAFVWVGVHFGSRGFGHKTATRYLELAGSNGDGIDAAPSLLPIDSELGQEYIAAMELAGAYAYAGRDVVVDRVLEILGTSATFSVHNHHNFAWHEMHAGEHWWVVRKGCTPAFPGQQGFVGATHGRAERDPRGRRHGRRAHARSSPPCTAPAGGCRARRRPGRWASPTSAPSATATSSWRAAGTRAPSARATRSRGSPSAAGASSPG